jgi:hypothetical protein
MRGILLTGLFGLYVSCEEQFPELPPETQSGKGTFGCLVNNELVFTLWDEVAAASYNNTTDQLEIHARCQFGQQFVFLIDEPYKKQNTISIDTIHYLSPDSHWVEATQTGGIRITRIDNQNQGNNVVSGTFFFDLNEAETPIHVTKGRFDLPLNIY